MARRIYPALVLALFLFSTAAAPAHYHLLLPQTASVKRGEPVTLIYQWGHPFEHQLFDADAPQSVIVVAPDGKKTDLTKTSEKTSVPGDSQKKVTAYRLRFTPDQRGDYLFVLEAAPVWMEEEQEFYRDTVKVVLHVQAQQNWDHAAEAALELVPLTRPYGLQPGLVFQAQALAEGKPLAGALTEVERYNPAPPKRLPPDEHITRTVKTDPNGVATVNLIEPGWWAVTVQRQRGQRAHMGKNYPVRERSTLWVFVDGALVIRTINDAGAP